MFAINAKEKNMKLSETKWDDNTLKTTHQKKIVRGFNNEYIE